MGSESVSSFFNLATMQGEEVFLVGPWGSPGEVTGVIGRGTRLYLMTKSTDLLVLDLRDMLG
jgi:hypothetical protein